MKVLSLALFCVFMLSFKSLALADPIAQHQLAQLPDWFNNWLDELKSLLTFVESINNIMWAQQIQPLLKQIVEQVKAGQINDQTVKEIMELLRNVANLVYIDSVDLVYGLSKSFKDLLEQIWDHRHNIQEFIIQTLYNLYMLTLDAIFYVLLHLMPALQADLQKVWAWIKEILEKIFGQTTKATRSLSNLKDLPDWLQKLIYQIVNLAKYIERVLASLPADLKKILEQLQAAWLFIWNNYIITIIQALLDYLSKHDPKLEKIVEFIVVTSEYVYLFTMALLLAEFDLIKMTIEFIIKVLEKIFHGLD